MSSELLCSDKRHKNLQSVFKIIVHVKRNHNSKLPYEKSDKKRHANPISIMCKLSSHKIMLKNSHFHCKQASLIFTLATLHQIKTPKSLKANKQRKKKEYDDCRKE